MTNSVQLSETCNSDNFRLEVDHLDYRGFHVEYYLDYLGKQVYTFLEGKRLDFGIHNFSYVDDTKRIIDDHLDTITVFLDHPEYLGAKLEWFQNGEFRDLKLSYRNRILKVWVAAQPEAVTLKDLERESLLILSKIVPKDIV